MRKGHDFHKDKDVGEFVKPWPLGKNPCVTTLFYFQPLSLKNGRWWLMQLLSLGVGWQDCQFSPTRTLHPLSTSLWQGKTTTITHARYHSLHECIEHPRTAISCPPCSCSPSRTSNCLLIVFTHRNFPGFTHAVFSLRIGE